MTPRTADGPGAAGRLEPAEVPALEGDLGQFFATEVLQFLQLAGATGRLEFDRAGERAEIGFEHGRPVSARTTGRSVRVGDVLVHRGAVPPAEIARALTEQQARPDQRLGTLLLASGAAGEDDVAAAVGEVFRRIVCGLALWPDGRFRFVPGEERGAGDVPLDLELDRVILEGLHRADLAQSGA
jgi:hypothetical protein